MCMPSVSDETRTALRICLFHCNLFVAQDCHNASTPLKSGIRIYRRLAADTGGSSPATSRRQQKHTVREMKSDDGRSDAVSDLKTACSDARPRNMGRVCLLADELTVSGKETVSIGQRNNVLNCIPTTECQCFVIKTN